MCTTRIFKLTKASVYVYIRELMSDLLQVESEGHGSDADTPESRESTSGVVKGTCHTAVTQTRYRSVDGSFQ